jgi:hypothetical protein
MVRRWLIFEIHLNKNFKYSLFRCKNMPPSKNRVPLDDSRSEASSTREKLGASAGISSNGKGRRVASGLGAISTHRDTDTPGVVSTIATVTTGTGCIAGQDGNAGVRYFRHVQYSLLTIGRCIGRLSTLLSYIHTDMHTD